MEGSGNIPPLAPAELRTAAGERYQGTVKYWRVLVCPLCGLSHRHYLGDTRTARAHLGLQPRACNPEHLPAGAPEYYHLVEAEPGLMTALTGLRFIKFPWAVLSGDSHTLSTHQDLVGALVALRGIEGGRVVNLRVEILKHLRLVPCSCDRKTQGGWNVPMTAVRRRTE